MIEKKSKRERVDEWPTRVERHRPHMHETLIQSHHRYSLVDQTSLAGATLKIAATIVDAILIVIHIVHIDRWPMTGLISTIFGRAQW